MALSGRTSAGRVELDAHGDAFVKHQRGDVADLHLVREAAAPADVVARHAPQRCHARKQHEQHQHDGCAQRRHPCRRAHALQQRGLAHGHVGVDERRQQAQQAQQHHHRHHQRLREEEVGQQGEEAQEEHHHGVAPRAQFQRLEHQQNDDERDARIAPDDGLVRHQREHHGQQQ
ncbi:hypothetical protein SDC9_122025 [bioreactor metagenome]|uniref:Uncharacterized protein n=1 Tax=bioreactor metagenome TaxID=1076179 RepID=A0A645CDL9_9ZZZZ